MTADWPLLALGAAFGLLAGRLCAAVGARATGAGASGGAGVVGATWGGGLLSLHPIGQVAGALVVVSALAVAPDVRGALLALLGLTLLAASFVDAATMRLPDALTATVAAASTVLAWLGGRLAEGAACALAALVVLLVLRAVLARRAGRQALGLGDVKLAAALALWLGAATPWFLVLAALGALVVILVRRPADGRLAFGPSLALGAWIVGLVSEAGLWPM
ncbi:hypothetical protein AS593_07185 [Caulobacter vibrioides]|nr:hypothetical protein AS593_07185 [Caulobacter vibrioides]